MGFFDGLEERITSPLFLGGAALLSGEGMGGAMQGMQVGAGMRSQRRKQLDEEKRRHAFQGVLGNPQITAAMDPTVMQLAQAYGPDGGMELLASRLPKPRDALDEEYKRAQIANLRRQAAGGGGTEAADKTPEGRAQLATQLGLQPGTDKFNMYVMTARLPREDQGNLTATDKKAIHAAEDDLAPLESTIDALTRAAELNDKSFSGLGAGVRAAVGSKLPDWLVPDMVADKAGANATSEFNKLMSMEAIQAMSATLKGATTDREMAQFVEILGDPSTHPDIRGRTIARLKTLAERQLQIKKDRISALTDGTYYQPGQVRQGTKPAPSGVGGAPIVARNPQTGETIEWNGREWVPRK